MHIAIARMPKARDFKAVFLAYFGDFLQQTRQTRPRNGYIFIQFLFYHKR